MSNCYVVLFLSNASDSRYHREKSVERAETSVEESTAKIVKCSHGASIVYVYDATARISTQYLSDHCDQYLLRLALISLTTYQDRRSGAAMGSPSSYEMLQSNGARPRLPSPHCVRSRYSPARTHAIANSRAPDGDSDANAVSFGLATPCATASLCFRYSVKFGAGEATTVMTEGGN